ncbi:crotonyl-CoA carboxylase/reductase [Actinomadura parmotrematis]|uniref:Crotonyl-CoA carboxylase/reductase n=1 Tax=Actinomadura parmotrematis TaxID=2864039 RepID=A0ABS7FRG4_9ACTN|nr:crotonyl-CoA carboxylase/reductase [Actinomadura parmotrematis]MBW8482984.1 crotonyl-CoA carboxylase/reductase [Actinomadura parmotrematis]
MAKSDPLLEAARDGAGEQELLDIDLPATFRASFIRKDEVGIFEGQTDKDVRRSMHVGDVDMPELAPDECVVAVMSAAINFNTVWSAIFEPVPTFAFLAKFGRQGWYGARHDLPYHILGSDGSGVVVRTGVGVKNWKVGDRVVISPSYVDEEDHGSYDDGMMSESQLAWGFETNFGSLGDYCIVKANQLIRKPRHLSWEEAGSNTLCAATAYRMLVGKHGAQMKQGDVVLIWGATGGLGSYATQLVKNGGGIPVGVVSSEDKADLVRAQGCEHVINRNDLDLGEQGLRHPKAGRMLGEAIRGLVGEDPGIVFEYLGRETFGASVYVAKRGGRIVTCGSSTGFKHEYDNRFLWMRLKSIIGSHGFNYHEAVETNRLFSLGMIHPTLSKVFSLEDAGEATRAVQTNQHIGKVAVLCGATAEGQGVDDPAMRERIGEEKLTLFRR